MLILFPKVGAAKIVTRAVNVSAVKCMMLICRIKVSETLDESVGDESSVLCWRKWLWMNRIVGMKKNGIVGKKRHYIDETNKD